MPENLDSADTRDLLERIEAGEAGALDRLLARDRDLIRQMAALRLSPELAARLDPSDVVQETQLQIVRRLQDYFQRRPMPYQIWLRRTALETLLRLRREHAAACRDVAREGRLPCASSVLMFRELVDQGPTPQQILLRNEQIEQIHTAVTQLSEIEQEVLLMRTVEGLNNQEVAQVLDIDPATASKRYGRALLSLRQVLERITSSRPG